MPLPRTTDPAPIGPVDPAPAQRLRRTNVIAGAVFVAQVVAIIAISKPVSLPVNVRYLVGPPGAGRYGGPTELFGLRVDIAVAIFLALAAIDHLAVASPRLHGWYERNVAAGINPARWWEYSISASIMVVLIAALAGITDAAALIAIFGANAAMILFGLAMERVNVGRDTIDWRPFIYGCIVGAVPWIAIAVEIIVAQSQTSAVPGFVYAIFVTLFLLFNTFALNMWLQYRGRGRWADPVFCERVYLMLSIVAKTALAWQVYFGALAGK
jgi:hypothetical protein